MKTKESLLLILLAALWGGSFIFIRIASPVMGPFALMDLRVLLAGIALLLYAILNLRLTKFWLRWKSYLILGSLNAAIPFTLIAFAELHLPASLAAIINSTTPLFTAFVAFLWLHDRLTKRKVFGMLMGIVGVGVLTGGGALNLTIPVFLSIGASLLAACLYGIGGVYSKIAFQKEPSLGLALGQQFGAFIILLPFAGASFPTQLPSIQVTLAILALAVLSTSLAYLIYFHLVAAIGPTNTLSVTFLVPVFGLIWGILFLHESPSLGWLIGLCIILFSMWCVTGMRFNLFNSRNKTTL